MINILRFLKDTFKRIFSGFHVTNSVPNPAFSETRDIFTGQTRDMKPPQNLAFSPDLQPASAKNTACPYCQGKKLVKKGTRKKKLEIVQLYQCSDCKKVFTPQKVKGKHFPLKVILDGLSFYNTGFTLEESCKFLKEKSGLDVKSSTLADWVKEHEPLCRYARMREFGLKLFSPRQVIQSVKLYHRQVYNFLYHRAKIALILQDFKHSKFEPLREFLDLAAVECPHQAFKDGQRASEIKPCFNLSEVMIREKSNFANRIAELVLQAVNDNKLRHETLQRFMLANDSVTVACEVPIYIDSMDIEHMRDKLGFVIPEGLWGGGSNGGIGTGSKSGNATSAITGHIDIMKKIVPLVPEESSLKKDLADCCMKIPHCIAEAHSRRFDDKAKAMKLLEEVLFLCNKMVVYLEQVKCIYGELPAPQEPNSDGVTQNLEPGGGRRLEGAGVGTVICDEIIKRYFYARQKVFNFYKAWKKFAMDDARK